MKLKISHYLYLLLLLTVVSCVKWQDKPGPQVDLTRRYCNLPEAINYNYDFPGIEDSTACIFPSQPFVGSYSYRDSLYFGDADAISGDTFDFNITAVSRTNIHIDAFCGSRTLLFTADRYYRATSDSIIGYGQLMCRDQDTLMGNLALKDSLLDKLKISFTVISDTGTVLHAGTAYKKL